VEGAKLTAALIFPGEIKRLLQQWRVGPPAFIDDRDVTLVQGTMNGRFPVNLYFDDESALLSRTVAYADSPVGLAPMQVDYADYRDINGIKFAFRITYAWLDGRDSIVLNEIQTNVPVDEAKFGKPAPLKPRQ